MATTGEYGQTNDCGASLPASGSCTITITFTPTAMGTQTGSLLVTYDAKNSPQNMSRDHRGARFHWLSLRVSALL